MMLENWGWRRYLGEMGGDREGTRRGGPAGKGQRSEGDLV